MHGDYSGDGEVIAFCPTRGNPERALEMVRTFYSTVHRIGSEVVLVVDHDDPKEAEYLAIPDIMRRELVPGGVMRPEPVRIMRVNGGSLTAATNEGVERILGNGSIIGHVGDDHRFRTPGWDTAIRDALLAEPGVAYAWDGHSSCWASAWWTNSSVIETLGWLALPGSRHLTIDDAFMDIGAATRLTFLEDVTIEHAWTNISIGFYATEVRQRENANYRRWLDEAFNDDIARVRSVLGLEPLTFDTRTPPGSVWRRDWKMANGYALGRDEPQPFLYELEEMAGRPLSPNSGEWLKWRRIWMRNARVAAGLA